MHDFIDGVAARNTNSGRRFGNGIGSFHSITTTRRRTWSCCHWLHIRRRRRRWQEEEKKMMKKMMIMTMTMRASSAANRFDSSNQRRLMAPAVFPKNHLNDFYREIFRVFVRFKTFFSIFCLPNQRNFEKKSSSPHHQKWHSLLWASTQDRNLVVLSSRLYPVLSPFVSLALDTFMNQRP